MKKIKHHIKAYLKAISQAFFLDNAYFGTLFLLLLLVFDSTLFVYSLIASLTGYAYSTRYSTPKVLKDAGLIPINCFFFGIALTTLFLSSPSFYLFFILGTIAMPLVTKTFFEILQHWKLSPFIMPYIFMVWIIWLCSHGATTDLQATLLWPKDLSTVASLHPDWDLPQLFVWSIFQSIGRLLFLPDPIFGALIAFLVTLFSPRRGFFFLLGTAVATLTAFILADGSSVWEQGFLGYSAGLVGVGLASFPEKFRPRVILIFCVLSSFLTLATGKFLGRLDLPLLSLPYVLTLWIAILSRAPRLNVNWGAQPKLRQWQGLQGQELAMAPVIEDSEKAA